MSIPYLRFRPGLSGGERQVELRSLRTLGVASLKPVFPGDDHPDRSTVYTVAVVEGTDRHALDDYINESAGLVAISHEKLEDLRGAAYPVRVNPRDKESLALAKVPAAPVAA